MCAQRSVLDDQCLRGRGGCTIQAGLSVAPAWPQSLPVRVELGKLPSLYVLGGRWVVGESAGGGVLAVYLTPQLRFESL